MAHQALEEIEPNGETVLIIGECLILFVRHIMWYTTGCGPIGLLTTGIAKAMGATKMSDFIVVLDFYTAYLSLL